MDNRGLSLLLFILAAAVGVYFHLGKTISHSEEASAVSKVAGDLNPSKADQWKDRDGKRFDITLPDNHPLPLISMDGVVPNIKIELEFDLMESWSMTQDQTDNFNSLSLEDKSKMIMDAMLLSKTWCPLEGDRLISCKLIDLNRDHITDMVAKWVNSNGRSLQYVVLTKLDGQYSSKYVDDVGEPLFYETPIETLLVAHEDTGLGWRTADPCMRCPTLYAWDGHALRDVSAEHKDYYLRSFIPIIENEVNELRGQVNGSGYCSLRAASLVAASDHVNKGMGSVLINLEMFADVMQLHDPSFILSKNLDEEKCYFDHVAKVWGAAHNIMNR